VIARFTFTGGPDGRYAVSTAEASPTRIQPADDGLAVGRIRVVLATLTGSACPLDLHDVGWAAPVQSLAGSTRRRPERTGHERGGGRMSEDLWGQQPPPQLEADPPAVWTAEPIVPADLTALRVQLRAELTDGSCPAGAGEDDIEQLLLAFEELASNGLRHGRPPVRVTVTTTGSGWVLEVSDGAPDRPPTPAIGRDPATGGLGLYLVAGLSTSHGWAVDAGRKRVWARWTWRRLGRGGIRPGWCPGRGTATPSAMPGR